MAAAATSAVTCVLPPAESATAVRESAPLTAKPRLRAEAEIGRAQGDEVPVGVDRVAVLGGEGSGRRHHAAEAHQCDAEGARHQRPQVVQDDGREAGGREPRRDRPHHRHPLLLEPEQVDRADAEHHCHQRGRHLRHGALQDQQRDEQHHPDGEGGHVGRAQPGQESASVWKNPPDATLKPNSAPSWPTMMVSAIPFK